MDFLKLNIDNVLGFISQEEIKNQQSHLDECYETLVSKSGKGNDFLGWIDLPEELSDGRLIDDIMHTANWLKANAEILVVVGIGGSYLGARAIIEALKHNFDSFLNAPEKKNPLIVYAGQNLSEDYLHELLEVLDQRDYAINVISKSGTTTEPAVAFRILKNHIEKKYGKPEAGKRIIATTDKAKGALKQLADSEGYKTYVVPDDVGGRYSVLTPVGLLPIAAAGFDIRQLVNGAAAIRKHILESSSVQDNPAARYAAARNLLYQKGRLVEIMVNYLPNLYYLTEWWKQLYGESEGKDGKGIFPAGVVNTTDLHSMGQYIQDGERRIFETVLSVEKTGHEILIPEDKDNLDKLNYIAGKKLQHVNQMAEAGTTMAHVDGGVPNMRITIPQVNEFYLGQLIYFYEFACGLSGYMLGVNPFDQPGVEAYKKNMFALLGKPGFEKETEELRKRL